MKLRWPGLRLTNPVAGRLGHSSAFCAHDVGSPPPHPTAWLPSTPSATLAANVAGCSDVRSVERASHSVARNVLESCAEVYTVPTTRVPAMSCAMESDPTPGFSDRKFVPAPVQMSAASFPATVPTPTASPASLILNAF